MLKKQILFIQGAGQGAYEGDRKLVTYLQEELGNEYSILYPKMKNPESPEYKRWKIQIEKELSMLDGEVILIGHSLGGSVLLKYLSEETNQKFISGLFLLAAPYWGRDEGWQSDEYVLQEDFPSKLSKITQIFLYHSYDDKIVPFDHFELYAKKLPQATIRQLDGRGHNFNHKFPEIVDDIKNLSY